MRAARVVILVLFVVLASACTRSESPDAAPKTAAPVAAPVTGIDAMGGDAKRSLIASDFPLEVPVPAGDVLSGESQLGGTVLAYTVVVQATSADLAQWYREMYTARGWTDTSAAGSEGAPNSDLTFRKHKAESRITIESDDGSVRASALIGLGVSVLQTQ